MYGMKQGKGSAQVEYAACGCPVCPAAPGVFSWKLDRGNQRALQLAEFAGREQWAVRGVPHKGMAARARRARGSLSPACLHSPPQAEASKLQE